METINNLHLKAHISKAKISDIEREINRKRDVIRQQLSELLQSIKEDTYIDIVSRLVKETVEPSSGAASVIILDVVDQYEIWAKAKIETVQANINVDIQKAKDSEKDTTALNNAIRTLNSTVNYWSYLTYPLQVLISKNGIDHLSIQSTAFSLRNLCIDLNNKAGQTKVALDFVRKLQKTVSSLSDVSEKLARDEEDLLKIQIENEEKKKEEEKEKKEELANRQADKQYSVTIGGDKFVAPPYCTCCLAPTSTKTNHIEYVNQDNRRVSIYMPLCYDCRHHEEVFTRKRVILCCVDFGEYWLVFWHTSDLDWRE